MMKQIIGFVWPLLVIGASSLFLHDAVAFTTSSHPGFFVGPYSAATRRQRPSIITIAVDRTTTTIFNSQVSDDYQDNNNSDNIEILPETKAIKKRKNQQPKVIYPFQDVSMLLIQNKKKIPDGSGQGKHAGISKLESSIRKIAMISYIVSMCIALPVTLTPIWLISQTKLIEKTKTEIWSHDIGQFCARWLLHMIPFCQIAVISDDNVDDNSDHQKQNSSKKQPEEPSIWVCNHTSMLDTFILLATDYYLRGPNKRPIKAIYWKGLEDNPVINLMFKLCGFIPVQMEANGSGNPNEYDKKSFLSLIRQTKKAFQEGFDILVLPEGQLNPWPEQGLLEVFPGAYKLALLSHYPIRFVALHGFHNMWHPNETIGMKVTSRGGKARVYKTKFIASSPSSNNHKNNNDKSLHGDCHIFESSEDFVDTFRTVCGYFGAHGTDHPDIDSWMDGTAWEEQEKMNGIAFLEKEGVEQESTEIDKITVRPDNKNGINGGGGGVEMKILNELEREGLLHSAMTIPQDDNNASFPTPVGVHRCKPPLIRHEILPLYGDGIEEEIATFLEQENSHVTQDFDQNKASRNIDSVAANGAPSKTNITTATRTTTSRIRP